MEVDSTDSAINAGSSGLDAPDTWGIVIGLSAFVGLICFCAFASLCRAAPYLWGDWWGGLPGRKRGKSQEELYRHVNAHRGPGEGKPPPFGTELSIGPGVQTDPECRLEPWQPWQAQQEVRPAKIPRVFSGKFFSSSRSSDDCLGEKSEKSTRSEKSTSSRRGSQTPRDVDPKDKQPSLISVGI